MLPGRLLLVALAACAACAAPRPSSPASSAPGAPATVAAELAARIPGLMAAGDIPGLSIALVRDRAIAWHQGFGVADARTGRPVTDATVFQAASLTKPVFAYAVMKLVDAGTLELDRPLAGYLPATHAAAGDPRIARITARHVLSHTTGFPNWRRGALATALPPGQQFSYSGEGFVYLARVVEHLTGEPFEAFVQRTVLVPLGMTSSRFVAAADDAVPHDQWGAANDDQTAADRTRNPAAGLRTTAVDYARFVIAVLRGTGLSPAAHAQMVTPQIHVIEGGPGSIDRADPRPLRDVAWGLGWGIETTASGVTWFHWGDNDDTKAYVAAQPASGAALVVLANSGNGLSIVHELAGLALPGPHPGLAWLGYEPYDAPGRRLAHAIRLDGVDAALRDYRAGGTPRLPERVLNELGYALARAGRIPDAIAVLTQNAEDHPSSGNTHDSLGEIYELAGDLPRAIASYARSVALDPSNTHGAEALARLRALPP